jgi:hypothetical protein
MLASSASDESALVSYVMKFLFTHDAREPQTHNRRSSLSTSPMKRIASAAAGRDGAATELATDGVGAGGNGAGSAGHCFMVDSPPQATTANARNRPIRRMPPTYHGYFKSCSPRYVITSATC